MEQSNVMPEKDVGRWFLSLSLTIVFYFIGSAIHNLYFSPLSKLPGPFFAKISGIPSFYHALKGTRHIWIWQCHQTYGEIFRFQPNGVMVNSPSGHAIIHNAKPNVKKGKFYEIFPRNREAINTLSAVDKVVHAKKRRVLDSAFSENALRSAETFIIKNVDRWCELLVENQEPGEWTEPKNATNLVSFLVFDILGDLAFGRSFESKESGENPLRTIPENIASSLKILYPITKSPFLNLYIYLKPRGLDYLMERMRGKSKGKEFRKFVQASVAKRTHEEQNLKKEREEGQETRRDVFHYLFQAEDPERGGQAYTPRELMSEASLLIIAGTDTTSVTLCVVFFYLTRNPKVYERLAGEVRGTFKDADDIVSGSKLAACQYLRACIDESLRMAPPVPSELPREVLPGGLYVDGVYIPEGTQIGTSSFSLMHHDSIYRDPWVFRPERWIVDKQTGVTADDVMRAKKGFLPFSTGVGNCAGMKLAMLEMTILVGRMIWRMEVRAVEGDSLSEGNNDMRWGRRGKGHFQIGDNYIAVKDGPMLQFRPRALV